MNMVYFCWYIFVLFLHLMYAQSPLDLHSWYGRKYDFLRADYQLYNTHHRTMVSIWAQLLKV